MVVLVFSSDTSIYSRLIKWFTWSKFSHVDILSDDGQYVVGSLAPKGVQKRLLKDIKNPEFIFFTDAPDSIKDDAETFVGDMPYGFMSILGFIFRSGKFVSRNSKVCSEFVTWIGKRNGYDFVERLEAYQVTPQRLYTSAKGQ